MRQLDGRLLVAFDGIEHFTSYCICCDRCSTRKQTNNTIQRPEFVKEKSRIGDWDADTIIGASYGGTIASLVDRASKFALPGLVEQRTADLVGSMMYELLAPFRDQTLTITADNGREFPDHKRIDGDIEAAFYFATPYHS